MADFLSGKTDLPILGNVSTPIVIVGVLIVAYLALKHFKVIA